MFWILQNIVLAFLASALVLFILIRTRHYHDQYTADSRTGIQKQHTEDALRIGGVGIFVGVLATYIPIFEDNPMTYKWLLAGLPVFLIGLYEDIKKDVHPYVRLVATFLGAAIFIHQTGYYIDHIDTPLMKRLFIYTPFAIAVTFVFLGGLPHALNMIDGYNGLTGGASIIMFGGLAILSLMTEDQNIALICLSMIGAILGFLLFNFPKAQTFLGDGGTYFIGFSLAMTIVALIARNPDFSPWTALLVVFYPIFELVFSSYRRIRREGHSPTQPDRVHMHNLVHRSYVRSLAKKLGIEEHSRTLTGAVMWIFPLLSVSFALIGYAKPKTSIYLALLFAIIYLAIYGRVALIDSYRKNKKKGKS